MKIYSNDYSMKRYKVIENGIEYDVDEFSNNHKRWYYKGQLHRNIISYIEKMVLLSYIVMEQNNIG